VSSAIVTSASATIAESFVRGIATAQQGQNREREGEARS
jgi:hypothetical protein